MILNKFDNLMVACHACSQLAAAELVATSMALQQKMAKKCNKMVCCVHFGANKMLIEGDKNIKI